MPNERHLVIEIPELVATVEQLIKQSPKDNANAVIAQGNESPTVLNKVVEEVDDKRKSSENRLIQCALCDQDISLHESELLIAPDCCGVWSHRSCFSESLRHSHEFCSFCDTEVSFTGGMLLSWQAGSDDGTVQFGYHSLE